MKRKKKLYSRPRKPFELNRIKEEDLLLKKYGLKNKKEIWKVLAKLNYYRLRAKTLAKSSNEEQEILLEKLRKIGLKVNSISDVLGLQLEDLLKRRLPTIISEKKLAGSIRQARQFVVHKNVLVDKKVINSPSYLVPVNLENLISLKIVINKNQNKNQNNKEKIERELIE